MSLHPTVVQRLAFVRYLYRVGLEQSKAPEPMSGVAILTLHDAVELFLLLCAEQLNTSKKDLKFMAYWDVLSEKLGKELSYKAAMRRLNEARNGLKHGGVWPSRLEVESHCVSVRGFFEDVTRLVFDVDFNSLSQSNFVEPEEARHHLVAAEQHVADGNLSGATAEIAVAFEIMLDDLISKKLSRSRELFPLLISDLDLLNSDLLGIDTRVPGGTEWAKFVNEVVRSVRVLREAVVLLVLGVDYRRYARFRALTPRVVRRAGQTQLVEHITKPELSADDVRFCYDFVVEAALKFRNFDWPLTHE